jgi:serine/threonine-protein kinase PknK
VERVVGGGMVIDSALVQELVRVRTGTEPLATLSAREREVLALMAEGRSNAGIARQIWITEGTIEKHIRSILGKLALPDSTDDHRRVLAVLAYLSSQLPGTW